MKLRFTPLQNDPFPAAFLNTLTQLIALLQALLRLKWVSKKCPLIGLRPLNAMNFDLMVIENPSVRIAPLT